MYYADVTDIQRVTDINDMADYGGIVNGKDYPVNTWLFKVYGYAKICYCEHCLAEREIRPHLNFRYIFCEKEEATHYYTIGFGVIEIDKCKINKQPTLPEYERHKIKDRNTREEKLTFLGKDVLAINGL